MANVLSKIKDYEKLKNYIALAFVTAMVGVFPVFLTNKYFNGRHDKLNFFFVASGILVALMLVAYIFMNKSTPKDRILSCKKGVKNLSVPDLAILCFLFSATISTILSDNALSSFTGDTPRNNGLLLILTYVVVYFVISRTFAFSRIVTTMMCITSGFASVLAIMQQFYWSPFDLFAGLTMEQCNNFISTISNRNLFTAYLCISLPVCFMMFVYGKKIHGMVVSDVAVMLNFAGMICGNSDNGLLGVAGLLILGFILFLRDAKKLSRYFFLVALMLVSCKLVRLFSYFMDDYYMSFSSVQKSLVYDNTYVIIGFALVLSVGLFILSKREFTVPKMVQRVAVILLLVGIVGVVFLIIYFSAIDKETELNGFMGYFRFDDSWGTHRGFMWIRAVYIFMDLPFIQKIFGTGPDTFRMIMDATGYNGELFAYKNEITDCAHNVYLNYLVTIGITGAVSYIVMVVSSIVRGIKQGVKNKNVMIFLSAVLCYGLQSIVNIDQPITTPLFILMIAILEAENRKALCLD